jgi:hypothetical protein
MAVMTNFIFLTGAVDALKSEPEDRRFFAVIDAPGQVRVRTSAQDPFAGLRGHDYIKARGLSPMITPRGRLQLAADCECAACVRERLLPAVQRICGMPEPEAE